MNDDRETLRRRALGRGIECLEIAPGRDLGRDIRLVRDADGLVDLAQVEGLDNLAQSLSIAFTTLRGSDVFDVGFGFDGLNALVEEPNALLVAERVRVAVVNLLMRDPRVRRIVDVQMADGRLEAQRAGSRVLDVRVMFETVTGERQTVDLSQGAFRA